MAQFKKLFEPLKLGRIELKNRFFYLATVVGYTPDFYVTDKFKAFYKEMAKGGAGLITVGIAFPSNVKDSPFSRAVSTVNIGIWDDSFIPGLKEVVDIIHEYDSKAIPQIGLQYSWQKSPGGPCEAVGPSAVSTRPGIEPRELTVEEIKQMIGEYGDAARRAREAGFDAVEFHSGVGYMISRFLSPLTNQRTDDYGGTLEKRMRFLLDIIKDAKKKTGSDYTYICRISAEQFMKGGLGLEESQQIAVILEKAGIDGLNIQVGWHECPRPLIQNFVVPGTFTYASEAIKKVVKIPVATAYRLNDPVLADQILAEGKADFIGMARALIADPYMPKKAQERRLDDICPCIACNYCLDLIMAGKPLGCSVNARVGKEMELQLKPAPKPKKVLVIGGGPAGMEAAAVAAQRGHKVTLIDEGDRLGGQLLLAAVPSYKVDIAHYINYLVKRVGSAGVEVRLGKKVTPALVAKLAPEVVIVASGATPAIPNIPGIGGPNVATAVQVLKGKKKVGANVVVVGSGLVGCETSEFLLEQGKKVTVLEMLPRLGADMGVTTRPFVLGRLRQAGVAMEANARVVEITAKGVKAQRDGETLSFEADSVVLATGMKSSNELLEQLKGGKYELHSIGDCVEPRRIVNAVEEAAEVAYRI